MLPFPMLVSPAPPPVRSSSKTHQCRKGPSDNISANPIRMNTSSTPRKCTFQATYGRAQSFRINTYEKTQGEGYVTVNQKFDEGFLSRGPIVRARRNARNPLPLIHLLHNSSTPRGGVHRLAHTGPTLLRQLSRRGLSPLLHRHLLTSLPHRPAHPKGGSTVDSPNHNP
jgi:hypothetical protein